MRDRIASMLEKMLPTDECVITPEEMAGRVLSVEAEGWYVRVLEPCVHHNTRAGKCYERYPELCRERDDLCDGLRAATMQDMINGNVEEG